MSGPYRAAQLYLAAVGDSALIRPCGATFPLGGRLGLQRLGCRHGG